VGGGRGSYAAAFFDLRGGVGERRYFGEREGQSTRVC